MAYSRFRDKIIIIVLSLTLLSVVSCLLVRDRTDFSGKNSIRPVPVSTVRPDQSDLQLSLSFRSTLETESSISIIPRVSGPIIEMFVEEGMEVNPGDLLVRLDPAPYLLEMKSAESAWLLAENSLERINSLHSSAGTSRQQLDEAETARDAALASYELARMQYEYSNIRSPITGIILFRYADLGSLASPAQPLFLIGNDGSQRTVVNIPEKHWNKFSSPETLEVQVSRPGEELSVDARILRMSPSISPVDRTFQVTCEMNHDVPDWPIGSRLETEFILEQWPESWSLPIETLRGDSSLWWIDSEKSTVHRAEDPGIFRNNKQIAVPNSWSGRDFVLDGHHKLREGMTVTAYSSAREIN